VTSDKRKCLQRIILTIKQRLVELKL